MIKVFARFVAAYFRAKWFSWRGYEPIAEPAYQDIRLEICQACDAHQDGVCTFCGCSIVAKTLMNSEQCPVKKWPRRYVRKLTPTGVKETV